MGAILLPNRQGRTRRLEQFHAVANIGDTLVVLGALVAGGPMDHPSGRPRWRTRPIVLGVLVVVALGAALALAPGLARTRVDATTQALTGWLWPTRWVWPLAAVLTLAAMTSPLARRRWPRPARRISPAIGVFAGLVGLASLATVSRPGVGLLALGVVVGVGLLAAWVLVVPRRVAPPVTPAELMPLKDARDRLEVRDVRAKLRNDVRTTAVQGVVGLAVLAGAVLGFRQLTEDRQQADATRRLTLQGQASERFTRAIDQLGSDRREVQLGGIYGLEQIAQQAPDNRLAVTEVLVAYLHRRIPRSAKLQSNTSSIEELRIRASDAQAALTVLGRRQIAPTDPPLDLRVLDLRRADLRGAILRGVDLSGADLGDAILRGADLSGADLRGADLRGAYLLRANLVGADLSGAILRGAALHGADLSGANLVGANLVYAVLSGANLVGADLVDADLSGAILVNAVVNGADLRSVDLSGANLVGADLGDAILRGATADRDTLWPSGFDWQGAGVRQTRSDTSP
jgi:uncharacterized protein YjbI with pentapeptide repeats